MPKTIDLNKYAVFETPQLEVKKVYDTIEDYKAVEKFNKSMVEVHRVQVQDLPLVRPPSKITRMGCR